MQRTFNVRRSAVAPARSRNAIKSTRCSVSKLSDTQTLPWYPHGQTVGTMRRFIEKCAIYRNDPLMDSYAKRVAVDSVLFNNKIEGTLPKGLSTQALYDTVETVLHSNDALLPHPAPKWPPDGGNDKDAIVAQRCQYARAQRFQFSVPELSSENLRQTHQIMMWGTDAAPGQYRSKRASAGTYTFWPAAEVPKGVEDVVFTFHRNLQSVRDGEMDMDVMAAALFFSLVDVHPFVNGNGRLCRPLAAYALQAAGEPFPVYFDNGHTKTRQQFNRVLLGTHRQGISKLAAFILECRFQAWQNFTNNLGADT